jgi:hypothetical protein
MEFKILKYDIDLNLKYFFGIQVWEKGKSDPIIQYCYSGFPYEKISSIIQTFIKYRICKKNYYLIFDPTVSPYHYSINLEIFDPNDF